MRNFMKFFVLAIFVTCVLFTDCKKKEIQGPKGEPGTPGTGGNSNIISTSVFTVADSQWKADTAADYMFVSLDFPEITQKVADNGAVKVYIQTGTNWTDLPYVKGDLFTQFGFETGRLFLTYINIEGGLPGPPATANYRMVILSEQ